MPDFLQHSVEIVAIFYQFWERHRFIPLGSQSCDHLWKPHSVGIARWQFIRAPWEAWNHIRELDCNTGFLAMVGISSYRSRLQSLCHFFPNRRLIPFIDALRRRLIVICIGVRATFTAERIQKED